MPADDQPHVQTFSATADALARTAHTALRHTQTRGEAAAWIAQAAPAIAQHATETDIYDAQAALERYGLDVDDFDRLCDALMHLRHLAWQVERSGGTMRDALQDHRGDAVMQQRSVRRAEPLRRCGARSRGAGRPAARRRATRSSSRSGDSGDGGPGEPAPADLAGAYHSRGGRS